MNEKLKQYLDEKDKLQKELSEKKKSDLLIREGLYEKEYSDGYNDEYSWYDNLEGKYYRKVPIEITDEEYQLLKEVCKSDNEKSANYNVKNGVAKALIFIACIIYIFGFIAGIGSGTDAAEYYSEFNFIVALIYWVVTLVSGTMFLGFAEIIKLLEAIKRKG